MDQTIDNEHYQRNSNKSLTKQDSCSCNYQRGGSILGVINSKQNKFMVIKVGSIVEEEEKVGRKIDKHPHICRLERERERKGPRRWLFGRIQFTKLADGFAFSIYFI